MLTQCEALRKIGFDRIQESVNRVDSGYLHHWISIKSCNAVFKYGLGIHIIYHSGLDQASLIQLAIQSLSLVLGIYCHIDELRLIGKNAFDLHWGHSLHLSPSHRYRHHLRLSALASHQVVVLCHFNYLFDIHHCSCGLVYQIASKIIIVMVTQDNRSCGCFHSPTEFESFLFISFILMKMSLAVYTVNEEHSSGKPNHSDDSRRQDPK
ncbi:hypothetical protein EDC96DRAFT_584930 [Choanephora cucurbitarum]|nr:hypothetical protein EDC96DRAFT_584930 [Choanephora cucurbitarum]